ncbi:MAG: hypothetical protein JSR67_00735 [Proteobacteria bacterium]|nr:hypothetical protein [Pseudomonadota bacterium]
MTGLGLLCALLLAGAGCSRGAAPAADAKDGPPAATAGDKADAGTSDAKDKGADEEGVTLKPEEIEKAGITTQAVGAASHAPETTGYAVVTAREAIAQAVADLATAAAVERQSRAALARVQRLAGTPGAMPVEAQESAQRQAAADQAALLLAKRRVAATFGSQAPWKDNYYSPALVSLANGTTHLARVTFAIGVLDAAAPTRLRFTHLGEEQGGRSAQSLAVWSAPADPALPGRSLFAILKGGDAVDGERLVAHAPTGAPQTGVIVPFAAAVISAGQYWCYVETRPGVFARTPIDTGMPTDSGYFVKAGIAPGAKVVVTAAGLLLARETNPATGAAD